MRGIADQAIVTIVAMANWLRQGAALMKRLLVVEDDVTLRQSLQRGMTLEGYVVFTAATGIEGYQLAIQ